MVQPIQNGQQMINHARTGSQNQAGLQSDQNGSVAEAKSLKDTSNAMNNGKQMIDDNQSATNYKKIKEEMDKLNDVLAAMDKNLRFKFHDQTDQLYVEVINTKTQEVIKSLPPEYMLELSVKMKELVGMIIDEKI